MKSMTGYGKGIAEGFERKVTVEIKSVNHRYLDLLIKLPRGFAFLEDGLRKLFQNTLNRGHLDVYCSYEDNRENKSTVKVDYSIAKQYSDIGIDLEKMGFVNDITAAQVLRLPDVSCTVGVEDDESIIKELALQAARDALTALTKMRDTEGKILKKDILKKLSAIEKLATEIEGRIPSVAEEHKERLKQRITEALENYEVDQARLLNEVAFFVDRTGIDEELTRLSGHIAHGRNIIKEKTAVGKKLDFLVQEMNREVNTIGSKCNDLLITQRVLLLKSEVEKIREQVQNIE